MVLPRRALRRSRPLTAPKPRRVPDVKSRRAPRRSGAAHRDLTSGRRCGRSRRQRSGAAGGPPRGWHDGRMPRDPELNAYLARNARQDDVLAEVARETSALPNAGMLSRPDAGALLTLLGRMLD